MKLVFVILICAPSLLINCQEDRFYFDRRSKPGECLANFHIGICDTTCFSDFHCRGKEKCCPTSCGGTTCTFPVPSLRNNKETRVGDEKQGSCPNPPTGPWVCSSRCSQDSDCRGSKKCCTNRCGAKACVKPILDSENDLELL